MGGVTDTLFGKQGKQTSESGNVNNGLLTGSLSPALGYLTGGGNMMGSLLGVNGGAAQTGALENYANAGGMKFLQEQGMKGITSSKAASGLLNSGSYGTALAKYNQGLASTYLNQYSQNLLDYSRLGLGAAGVLASSGSYSKGQGTSPKQGMAPQLAEAAAAFA